MALRPMVDASSAFSSRVVRSLTQEGTSWIFNPPSALHFGGIWEAAVKSAKYHLRRVIGDQTLTFSELILFCAELNRVLRGLDTFFSEIKKSYFNT